MIIRAYSAHKAHPKRSRFGRAVYYWPIQPHTMPKSSDFNDSRIADACKAVLSQKKPNTAKIAREFRAKCFALETVHPIYHRILSSIFSFFSPCVISSHGFSIYQTGVQSIHMGLSTPVVLLQFRRLPCLLVDRDPDYILFYRSRCSD